MTSIATTVHLSKWQRLAATAQMLNTTAFSSPFVEDEETLLAASPQTAFVDLSVNVGPNRVSFFLHDRAQIESLRAAVAQADDLLAQIEAARAVEDKIARDRDEADAISADAAAGKAV